IHTHTSSLRHTHTLPPSLSRPPPPPPPQPPHTRLPPHTTHTTNHTQRHTHTSDPTEALPPSAFKSAKGMFHHFINSLALSFSSLLPRSLFLCAFLSSISLFLSLSHSLPSSLFATLLPSHSVPPLSVTHPPMFLFSTSPSLSLSRSLSDRKRVV